MEGEREGGRRVDTDGERQGDEMKGAGGRLTETEKEETDDRQRETNNWQTEGDRHALGGRDTGRKKTGRPRP